MGTAHTTRAISGNQVIFAHSVSCRDVGKVVIRHVRLKPYRSKQCQRKVGFQFLVFDRLLNVLRKETYRRYDHAWTAALLFCETVCLPIECVETVECLTTEL